MTAGNITYIGDFNLVKDYSLNAHTGSLLILMNSIPFNYKNSFLFLLLQHIHMLSHTQSNANPVSKDAHQSRCK